MNFSHSLALLKTNIKLFVKVLIGIGLNLVPTLTSKVWSQDRKLTCLVLATVEKRPITTSDVWARFLFLPKIHQAFVPRSAFPQYAASIFRQILVERLQLALASKYKIQVSPFQLDEVYGSWVKDLKKASPSITFTEQEVKIAKEQLKASLCWESYIEGRYGSEFTVTSEEIERYKKNWKQRPASLEYIRYGEIVIFYTSRPEKALKEMENIKTMLDQGTPFAQVAAQFSQSNSKKNSGIVEWVPEYMLDPDLLKIFSYTPEGQVVGPHILANSKIVGCFVRLGKKKQKNEQCPSQEKIKNILRQGRKNSRDQQEMDKLVNEGSYEILPVAETYFSNPLAE